MKTKDARKEFEFYRARHLESVVRDKGTFAKWYDKAAEMVFSGNSKSYTIKELAPRGCEQTQSNGVVAGACQANILLKTEPNKKER